MRLSDRRSRLELGYTLSRLCVISAQAGTKLPFDEAKLPTCFWVACGTVDDRREAYLEWLGRPSSSN